MLGKKRVLNLLSEVISKSCRCPSHSSGGGSANVSPSSKYDYAFEMGTSTVRFGPGVSSEVGMDVLNMKGSNVLLMTDENVSKIPTFKLVLDSLTKHNIKFEVFDDVGIEPSDKSVYRAVEFSRNKSEPFDLFIGFGGGSVMDTCKMVNLLSADRDSDLMDYANKPIGKGKIITKKLKPLIALPTTAGTGSETTGVAVFENSEMKAKVGIAQRILKPSLGLIDPLHSKYLPRDVAIYSGFDVFCHALESYTTLPYNLRKPRPENPSQRPAYQGANPLSDVWAIQSLVMTQKYFLRSVNDASDDEARYNMQLASSIGGMGLGNAGVHLCHGMSYPISALTPSYSPNAADYVSSSNKKKHWVPHGLSVVITAPAVFQFTAPGCRERHIHAASLLKPELDTKNIKLDDAGKVLSDIILEYMDKTSIPNGLSSMGFSSQDIPALVKSTLPQERVVKLSPKEAAADDLASIFENSMTVY